MPLPADLLRAYLATTYAAATPIGRIELRIGRRHPRFDRWLRAHGQREWVFISACNPSSHRLADAANRARQRRLGRALHALGLHPLAGAGEPDPRTDAHWSAEPSFLVPGLKLPTAARLAAHFGQLAIVCGRLGKPARLQLLRATRI